MKLRSMKSLKKKAWDLFSRYVRKRDEGVCYTCGDIRPWKEQNAGHFVHKDCLDYDEMNIHCQCVRCNKWLHGNLATYSLKLICDYGLDAVNELIIKGNQIKKFTRQEIEDIIKKYEQN